jgi:hypothetical protein
MCLSIRSLRSNKEWSLEGASEKKIKRVGHPLIRGKIKRSVMKVDHLKKAKKCLALMMATVERKIIQVTVRD